MCKPNFVTSKKHTFGKPNDRPIAPETAKRPENTQNATDNAQNASIEDLCTKMHEIYPELRNLCVLLVTFVHQN